MKHNLKRIIVFAVLAVFGLAAIAFAGRDGRHGHMAGPGRHAGDGYYGNLSADEIAALEQQRSEFFQATEDIRAQLYEKELALQNELGKVNRDTGEASRLQGEISQLRSDLDQKRLEFDIQAKKSVPNYNPGWGHGSMMGYGSRGGGYCMR